MEAGSFGKKNELNSRNSAGQMPGTDLTYLREAARMFESAGKFEFAASCYRDSGEFERAGKMYFDVCEKIDEAAECFTLAGCYSEAAEVYAKGSRFSNCLLVCMKGKLFYKGLEYIEYWKEHVHVNSNEMESIEQEFLESGALNFHEHNDRKSMMTFVRCFCSMESKRVFLRSLGCLDDLLLLEEESGHFLEAAELARSCGDVLKEASLLEKAGHLKEATVLLLWYVSFTSLWGNGNKGWPLKQFSQKEELCSKVKLLAIKESDILYDFVSSELKVLSDQPSLLPELKKDLYDSLKNESRMGEILSVRKILDAHFLISFSEYEWEDELPYDINKHCEIKITKNKVSVRTLVHYWNLWKENVASILQSFVRFENEEPSNDDSHVDFILNYFGVRKRCVSGNMVYLLVNKDADWIRNAGQEGLHNDGKLLTIDMKQLVFAIRSYWQSELLSVGMTVLETLKGLHNLKSKRSAFQQSTSLLHIFEVSKFLLDCKYLNLTDIYKDILQNFLDISLTYFDIVFPLDWRKTVSEDLVTLKETDLSLNLLDEIILQTVNVEGDFTFRTLGRVMIICFSSRKPSAHYVMLFKGILFSAAWNSFFEIFCDDGFKGTYAIILQNALKDAHICDSGVSPHSFVYLLESLLSMAYSSSGTIFTTKSSFVGCLTHIRSTATPTLSAPKHIYSEDIVSSVVEIIQEVLYNKEDIISWIKKSKIDHSYYYPLLALKLVMMLSLICLEISDFSQVLLDLMSDRNTIAYLLPENFVFNLLRGRNGRYLNLNPEVVAEAFVSVDDPLLIVSSENESPAIHAPSAIFVDLTKSKVEIMSLLFPKKDTDSGQNSSNNVGVGNDLSYKIPNLNPVELQMNLKALEDLSEAINRKKEEALNSLSAADTIKKELDKSISTLASALEDANRAFEELKLLSSKFDVRRQRVELHKW